MNVSFLYFGKIPQLNGAAVFFNSLIENKMAFEASLGVSVSFYYQRTIESSNSNKPSAGSRFSLKKMLNYFLPKTLIGSLLYFFIFYQRNAKRVIKSFMAKRISDDTETLILNDIFVGIECLKSKCIDLSKSVLILHNDETLFR